MKGDVRLKALESMANDYSTGRLAPKMGDKAPKLTITIGPAEVLDEEPEDEFLDVGTAEPMEIDLTEDE